MWRKAEHARNERSKRIGGIEVKVGEATARKSIRDNTLT